MSPPTTVLFVCLHGAAKSLIAARYFQRLAAERGISLECRFAGLEPDDEIPASVVAGMLEDGFDVSGEKPVGASAAIIGDADHVIAFGCDLESLGAARPIRWDDVPAVSDDYGVARNAIVSRLRDLLDTLPLRTGAERA